MNKQDLDHYKEILTSFRRDFKSYVSDPSNYRGTSYDRLRTPLHEKIPVITRIVSRVHGGGEYFQKEKQFSFYSTLAYSLDETTFKNDNWHEVNSHVDRIISEAIGRINDGIFPPEETKPILPIKDPVLGKRCLDLLNAPGSFDRVINQATQVLEERLRNSVPYEKLCELIPLAKDQIGESLANKLLSSTNPVIVVSDKQLERIAFHKMVVGIIAYLRNPSHHSLNDDTEWSLAWSVVGLIDNLLLELENSYVIKENSLDPKEGESK